MCFLPLYPSISAQKMIGMMGMLISNLRIFRMLASMASISPLINIVADVQKSFTPKVWAAPPMGGEERQSQTGKDNPFLSAWR